MARSESLLKCATAYVSLLLLAQPVFSQLAGVPPAPPPPPNAQGRVSTRGRATFSLTMSQVIVNVSVTDRNGKPVENLTKEDFELYEDGKLQKLAACEFQRLGTKPLAAIAPESQFATRTPEPAAKRPKTESETATPTTDLLSKYQDRRLIVILFDFSSMDIPEQIRARDAALNFLAKQMTASDMVSIMVFGSELKTVQDFTADRDLLTSVIHGFHIAESADLSSLSDTGGDAEDQSGMFTPDDTEFNIFNTDRKLAALQEAAQKLVQYPEKKALVYISSGVPKTGVDNQSQLDATVNAAVRANVAFFPIDARGLVAQAPGGDATQAGTVGSGLYSGAGQRSQKDSFQDTQETLYSLAADTGGKALLDDNDLLDGFRTVQQTINSYYVLAYESSNPAQDGKYRRIQVKLTARGAALKASLDYRKGYFAPATFAKMHASDKDVQLQTALDSENPVTDLPLAVEVDYFRLEKNKYFVPITVRIPGSALPFQSKGSKRATALDFIAQVRDAKNRVADSVRDTIPLKIDEGTAGEVQRKHIQYDTGLTLPSGKYMLRFVARENGEGKVGTFQTAFVIPELDSQKTVRLSSLILSNQIQPEKDQLAGVKNSKKLISDDPLVSSTGQKLVPNVTRVFRPGQTLYGFLQVYDPTVPENLPGNFNIASITSTLALYDANAKVFESQPLQLWSFNGKQGGTMDLRFQTALKNIKPGRYTCQVNVIDELGHKFAFPRVSMVVLADDAQRASL